jgi:signal transduction histidine kinase/DNA-binding response OmpR family regulator
MANARDLNFLSGGGEMGAMMRAKDWSETALGPPETWPQRLRSIVNVVLTSRFAMWMGWGEDLLFFYNDAYAPTLGVKHGWALGEPSRCVWAEIWDDIGPRIETVLANGEATWDEALLLLLERNGYREETYHTFSYSPLRNDDGSIAGNLCVVTEDTARVIGERRLRTLRDVAAGLGEAAAEDAIIASVQRSLTNNGHDLPFSLMYLWDTPGAAPRLVASTGFGSVQNGEQQLSLLSAQTWRPDEIWAGAGRLAVDVSLANLPMGAWQRAPAQALVLPIARQGQDHPAGFLVAGLNPHRALDEAYGDFLGLVAGQIASGLSSARAYEEERQRAEALAELDRAKTDFFSNVSHEFRTPLTLMLGPLEDLLAGPEESLTEAERGLVTVAHRNGLRLLKLVNSLLDFSRIEAGRIQASYEPVDLAVLTAELASIFRSACERAGLAFDVDCPSLGELIHVDRDMWERIVLNLISNAFKFTFKGGISVSLHRQGDDVALSVRDTGTGIPAHELPRLFDRFHRVEGARGRTHEGTGIGLALVQELAKLHGGSVRVKSVVGEGSIFTVVIPRGTAYRTHGQIRNAAAPAATSWRANPYVEEALRWLPDQGSGQADLAGDLLAGQAPGDAKQDPGAERQTVLVADDNADVREYVSRLLRAKYHVRTASDGEAALAALRADRPDLLLSDVMMPLLDGFGLLRAVRTDPALADIPVILLSARAGEDASIEGLQSGADDYLVKPFSARELMARVDANLKLARIRAEAAKALRTRTAELETLLQTVPLAVWFTSDPDAVRVYGNAAASRLLRMGETENHSRNAPPGERAHHYRAFRGGLELAPGESPILRAAHGETVRGEELDLRFDDGTSVTIHVDALPVRDPDGNVVAAVCAAMDITHRRQAEDDLRRLMDTLEQRVEERTAELLAAQEQLRQAQKMEAIGQLTGGIAHDFNNMLSGIIGGTEILQKRLATGRLDDVQRFMDAISASARRAASLTQRLLAFARRQSLEAKVIDPNALAREMLEILTRTLGENISLNLTLQEGIWPIEVDTNQLENALLNLAINARDAMPSGGILTICSENLALDPRRPGKDGVPPGDYVVLAVTDTGQGMSAAVRERVFEPFFTTKPIGQGTGLGLSMIYGFVKQSNGHIDIDSEPGKGTTVRLLFPRSQVKLPEPGTQPGAEPPRARSGETVLVVEDEATVRMLITEVLDELGYDFVEAIDSDTALPILRSPQRIDLLVTDVGLPGMNGRQLAEMARGIRAGLKVLFVTGYAEAAARRTYFLDSGMELIAKPFAMQALGEKIRALIEST